MKYIFLTIKTLLLMTLFVAIAVTIFWFLNDQDTREDWYNKTVAEITGKSFDESFDHNHGELLADVENDSVLEHSKRHADPTYVCPMHSQIIKGEEGSCPICGMNLVLKEPIIEEPVVKEKEEKILYWVAPMDANYRRDKPGKSLMGMDLVPVYDKSEDDEKEKKILYWVAPMDSNYRRDEPGKSLMGMDLVPVYDTADDDMGNGLPRITINASTAQNMGVRIEKAKIMELSRTIKTIGSVTYNEDKLHHVHARANGWVEKVYTNSLGAPVEKGKALLEFYSPDILAAQKDLVISNRAGSSLGKASRTRLRDLNVPKSVIDRVSKTGKSQNHIPIIANHSGVVIKIGIKNGMYITPGTEIYTIADLSSVWIIVDVFEHQLTWVKVGNKAEIQVQGVPGKTWEGNVDYIYPELNPKTRTLKVRLTIDTPKQLLKPNMFADVTLFTSHKTVLTVPSESIIFYENSPRLVKVVAKNKYQPIEIKIGMKSNGQVEILEGIEDGDEILVSGQFMIDSESNLQASFRRMSGK